MDGWMDRLTDGPTNRLIDRQTNGYFRITSTPVIDLFSLKANTDDGRGHRICTFPGQNILIIALELRKYRSATNILTPGIDAAIVIVTTGNNANIT